MDGTEVKDEDAGKVSFEDAIDKTGFGLYNYSLIGLAGTSIIAYTFISFNSGMIIPTSSCELQTTSAQMGILATAPLIGNLIGSLFWSHLGDRKGRRKMLLLSQLCSATFNAIASLSVHWAMLLTFQVFTCFFAAGQYSLIMTLLSESVPRTKRNFVVLLVSSVFMFSHGFMAVLVIPIIPLSFSYYLPALGIYWNSWRTLVLVLSIPSLICAVWLSLLQESPKYVLTKGDEAAALEILRNIHRVNKRNSWEEFQVTGFIADPAELTISVKVISQMAPLFQRPLLRFLIIMTTLSIFLQTSPFLVWIPRMANQFVTIVQTGEGTNQTLCGIIRASADVPPDPDAVPCALDQTALLIVISLTAFQSLVNAILSIFVNRVGRRNMIILISLICGLSGTFLNLVPNAYGSGAMFSVFTSGLIVMGLHTMMTMALFPTHLRAFAIALTMSGSVITNLAMVQVTNYLLVNDCELAFYILPTIFASSAIVAAFLPDDRYLKQPAETPEEPREDTNESLKRTVL